MWPALEPPPLDDEPKLRADPVPPFPEEPPDEPKPRVAAVPPLPPELKPRGAPPPGAELKPCGAAPPPPALNPPALGAAPPPLTLPPPIPPEWEGADDGADGLAEEPQFFVQPAPAIPGALASAMAMRINPVRMTPRYT